MTRPDNPIQIHEPLDNTIITEGNSSGPDIDLDQNWTELDQLRWLAGVVKARTGLHIRVTTGGVWRDDAPLPGFGYGIGPSAQGGSMDFHTMWLFLIGVQVGAEAKAELR